MKLADGKVNMTFLSEWPLRFLETIVRALIPAVAKKMNSTYYQQPSGQLTIEHALECLISAVILQEDICACNKFY